MAAPARESDRARGGFALVETMVAVAILAIVLSGVIGAMVAGMNGSALAADTSIAMDAARQIAEQMAARSFNQVFACYNATAADDPLSVAAPGANFDVPGLSPRPGDTNGVGRIIMPADPADATRLLETSTSTAWLPAVRTPELVSLRTALGMPRDLDGDGVIGTGDVAHNYVLLPVTILIEWRGAYGDGSYALHVLLADRSGS